MVGQIKDEWKGMEQKGKEIKGVLLYIIMKG